ncbi:hypothetical protein K440DRAFT_225523 [Wilcoxina mikolae CBS 423.85]|nr:hypothetical protein K440DRAFT_225523 [Wilcoxina mikolae CBS 423.85]
MRTAYSESECCQTHCDVHVTSAFSGEAETYFCTCTTLPLGRTRVVGDPINTDSLVIPYLLLGSSPRIGDSYQIRLPTNPFTRQPNVVWVHKYSLLRPSAPTRRTPRGGTRKPEANANGIPCLFASRLRWVFLQPYVSSPPSQQMQQQRSTTVLPVSNPTRYSHPKIPEKREQDEHLAVTIRN